MKYLITLTLTIIALYAVINRLYKYATVQDMVVIPKEEVDKGLYMHFHIDNYAEPSLDYESDKYKEAETWFSGMGRC